MDGRVNNGGPRPKTREDDRRGWNHREKEGPPGGTAYVPNEEHRAMVEKFAVVVTKKNLAKLLGISESTIDRHYRDEYDYSAAMAYAGLGSKIFRQAMNGNTSSQALIMKTLGGWHTSQNVEITGRDGGAIQHADVVKYAEMAAQLEGEAWDEYVRTCERFGVASAVEPVPSDGAGGSEADQT